MKYHVHVYQIAAMTEHEIDAEDDTAARELALSQAKATHPRHFAETDCKFLAIVFDDLTTAERLGHCT
jgi:hypothetical protein